MAATYTVTFTVEVDDEARLLEEAEGLCDPDGPPPATVEEALEQFLLDPPRASPRWTWGLRS
jgi:hypothetical protein